MHRGKRFVDLLLQVLRIRPSSARRIRLSHIMRDQVVKLVKHHVNDLTALICDYRVYLLILKTLCCITIPVVLVSHEM